jgi:hypothetical protein
MDAHTFAVVIAGGGALGVIVWVLAKLGKALIKIAELSLQRRRCSSPCGWRSRPCSGHFVRCSSTGEPA